MNKADPEEKTLEELIDQLEAISVKNYYHAQAQRVQRRDVRAKKRKQRQKQRQHKNRK